MKTIGNRNSGEFIFVLIIVGVTGILPCRIVAQDKAEDMAKRIEQLEKENAELRAEIKTLQQAAQLRYEIPRIPGRQAPDLYKIPGMTKEQADLLTEANRLQGGVPKPPVYELPGLTPEQREMLAQANASRSLRSSASPPPPAHRELQLEELALAQKYYDYVAKQFESGRSTLEELSRAQRQLFALKREGAGFDGSRAKLKETVQEEMELVGRLLKDAKKRIEAGTAAAGSELDLEREVLKLKRELLSLE